MKLLEKIWLQPQSQTGDTKIAILVRQTIHAGHGRPGLAFMAKKQPVAVIIATNSTCKIINLHEGAHLLIDDERVRREINAFASGQTEP